MKLLVATSDKQGKRKNDFSFANEGELVYFGTEHDGEGIDGDCGCRRSMFGIDSHKGTTTMKLAEVEITPEELAERVGDSLRRAGWVRTDADEADLEMVADVTNEMMEVAKTLPVGFVVERRGTTIQTR